MKRDAAWPVGIVLLLATFVAANLFVMRIAGADPSFAVEPDYYQKAVGFDSTMALTARSNALGWTARAGLTSDSVTVHLIDARARPATGATVTISARFNARAADVHVATLIEGEPGRYVAPLTTAHAGEWEVRVDASRGIDRFVTSLRTVAPGARHSP